MNHHCPANGSTGTCAHQCRRKHTHLRQQLTLAITLLLAITSTAFTATTATAQSNTQSTHPPLPLCEEGTSNPDGTTRTYQDYALCLAAELDQAIASVRSGNTTTAYNQMNSAYYGWYENALEPPSMTLPGNRKISIEGRFTRTKLALKSIDTSADSVITQITDLQQAIARDAMVLDGVAPANSPETIGAQLLNTATTQAPDTNSRRWVDFTTALTLLLREGLEALLVIAAIVLYLIKGGHRRQVRHVYAGALAAIICSFALAFIMKRIAGGASLASEMIEGFTMFLAVAMLFYVSNWMLSRTSGENWSQYIKSMVAQSISTGAARTLVIAAFLAVLREGAELVLFYTASFTGADHNTAYVAAGLAVGAVILTAVFIAMRYGGVRLPVRPVFYTTSILLFILCISFVGKGVQELREAGVILGTTNLPWMHYYLPDLGIYPQAESLLPQVIILIAAIWSFAAHTKPSFSRAAPATSSSTPTPAAPAPT